MVSVFQMLSYHTKVEKLANSIARILIEVLGTVLMVTGTYAFFTLPENNGGIRHGRRLNHKDRYFGGFSLCMAIFMMIFSILIGVGASMEPHRDIMYLFGNIASIIQKVTQSFLYYTHLQYKTPLHGRRVEAAWFLRALSLLNFLLWLNDLLNLSSSNDYHLEKVFGGGLYTTVSVTNDSIVVEYRLLLSMLFLEQSMYINIEDDDDAEHDNFTDLDTYAELVHRQQHVDAASLKLEVYRIFGLILGIILIVIQFGNIMEYTSHHGGWSNIFGIFTDIMVILLGVFLYLEVRLKHYFNLYFSLNFY